MHQTDLLPKRNFQGKKGVALRRLPGSLGEESQLTDGKALEVNMFGT